MARFGRRTAANPKRPSVRALSVGDGRTLVSSATELRRAIPAARDLLRRRELAQRVRLVETKP